MNYELLDAMVDFISAIKAETPWDKGIKIYALELMENYKTNLEENAHDARDVEELHRYVFNGAPDGIEYGKYFPFTDTEKIAKRLCNKFELMQCDNGKKKPVNLHNCNDWFDMQGLALRMCYGYILGAYKQFTR